ncbi:MAG: DegT/DnrJ/EryC1/StrS family aminotransferase [Chloroflexota bacterium]
MTIEERRIPFAVPDVGESEISAMAEVMRSGWITTGPKTKEFETAFSARVGADHAVMVNSCTAALHLALEAIGLGEGDEVIVPSMTFAATANVVRFLGARPVLVDVRASDHNVSPEAIEAALSPRTKAIIPVHFAGLPCDMDEISSIAKDHGAYVIDDAAHCFPCDYRGRAVGSLADITCFSFYATKTMTTGEGGAAVTANPAWAERMRMMSLHGIAGAAWKRYLVGGKWYYEVHEPGYKYNLTDIASAIGLVQLGRSAQMLRRREEIARAYDAAFGDLDAYELPIRLPDRGHARHLYVLKLRRGVLNMTRDEFIEMLGRNGIGTSVHFIPLHMHPYYRDLYGYSPDDFPVARDLFERSVSLPIFSRMSDEDVCRVIEVVRTLAYRTVALASAAE